MFLHINRGYIIKIHFNYILFTYYVVAQLGQNNIYNTQYYFATDYMLETVLFMYYLLFINTFYLYKLDAGKNNILLNSQKNNSIISCKLMSTQSAENLTGFSETVRQLPKEYKF